MQMENNQIMMKEKLEFFGIIKEALSILTKNPKFIILTLVTSLPLFCSLLLQEVVFQQTLVEAIKILTYVPPPPTDYGIMIIDSSYGCTPLCAIKKLFEEVSQRLFLSVILCVVIVLLLDLLNTITTVSSASVIYAGGQMNLKEMLCRPIKKVGFKGPLVTSMYALLLASLTIIGLLSLATNIYMASVTLFMVLFGVVPFIALLTKYIEWSAIWNNGIVISILEEKHGYIALGVSAYISRGSRKRGFLLMLVFFVWRIVLRLSCLYLWWQKRGSGVVVIVTIGQVCLVCLENVMKSVAFMVYFYDCKKRFLEKKIDVEEGKAAAK